MTETATRTLDIYVVTGKRKPVKTDKTVDLSKPIPQEITYSGTTFYFSNADLVDKTATFVNVPINWH